MELSTVESAIRDYQQGKMVILVDDENRENEGDLALAAQFVTPQAINFMAQYGRGLICVAMTGERLDQLGLPMMVPPSENTSGFSTAFTVSVEAKRGVTTGISAFDRAHTIQTLINPQTTQDDLARPGHVFPLRAQGGGVLARRGQTEASVDLAKLAGLYPASVICEVLHEDGMMKRLPQLKEFAKEHDLKIISVEALVQYREQHAKVVEWVTSAEMPTEFGRFRAHIFHESRTGHDHMALVTEHQPAIPLVRVHSECLTGDALGSARCDCGPQLREAQRQIQADGGVLLYLRQEGRGIGLANKIKAYALQDTGLDTVEANHALGFASDLRRFDLAAEMLRYLGIEQIRLLTNNPKKVNALREEGVDIVERVPLVVGRNPSNEQYLETKRVKMDHLLPEMGQD